MAGKKATMKKTATKKTYKSKINYKKLASMMKLISLKQSETKESWQQGTRNLGLVHNAVAVLLNPFVITQGTANPIAGTNSRIGDKIILRGIAIKGFFENALNRPKVFFRVMLVRCAKGDTINAITLFKGNSAVKVIDQVNTDRFKIIKQKTFNITPSNTTAVTVNADGSVATGNPAGIGTRAFTMWVPGRLISKYGTVQYEDGSTNQPKFYDYRVVVLCYDWYGSDGTSPTVGRVNDIYSKTYFKDP